MQQSRIEFNRNVGTANMSWVQNAYFSEPGFIRSASQFKLTGEIMDAESIGLTKQSSDLYG